MNKLKIILIGLLCLSPLMYVANAQNVQADSISILIQQSHSEVETAQLKLELSWALKYENLDEAINIAKNAFADIEKNNDQEGIAVFYSYLGVYEYFEKNITSSIQHLKMAEGLFKSQNNMSRLGRVYNNLGTVYGYLGDNETALSYYKKGLELKEENNEPVDISTNLINISTIYFDQGDFEKCIETNEKALILTLQNNDYESIATVYSNLGATYERLGDYKKSVNYTLKALDIYHTEMHNPSAEIRIYGNLGSNYLSQGLLEEARYYFSQAKELNLKVKSNTLEVILLNNIAELERVSKNYDLARSNANHALKIAHEINYTEEKMIALEELYLIEQDSKNFEAALTHYINYIDLSDSLMAVSNKQKTEIALAQNQLVLDKIAKKKQEERNNLKFNKIKILYMLLVLAGILLSIWLVLFFKGNRHQNIYVSILNFMISLLILAAITMFLFLKTTLIATKGSITFFLILMLILLLGSIMHQVLESLFKKPSK